MRPETKNPRGNGGRRQGHWTQESLHRGTRYSKEFLDQLNAHCEKFIEAHLLEYNPRTRKAACPFHSETKPSFHLYPGPRGFNCFSPSCGKSGNIFTFCGLTWGDTFPEAVERVAEWIGTAARSPVPSLNSPRGVKPEEDIGLIIPVPVWAPRPSFWHRDLGRPAVIWPYRTLLNELFGYTVRFETEDGKEIRPLVFTRYGWRWKGFPAPYPLYGLGRLQDPSKPVLLTEGEKAADAGQKHLPEYAVLSIHGGSSRVARNDFSPLRGRQVVIWPDADDAGMKCAQTAARLINGAGAASVQIVELPAGLPRGWDLADPIPEEVA